MNDFDIDKISALSRLEIRDNEKETLIQEMNSMVAFANKVKTSDKYNAIEKTYCESELRADKTAPSIDRETLLSQAPQTKNGYISVARTVKESEDVI
jgi:aspartyl/glutamyl-tRNA(Asn/Gln) amidotransferase C subunit